MNIGFIGSGRMGSAIIGRLMSAGHVLSVFDIDPRATAGARDRGAKIVASPAGVAKESDLIFICVPGPKEVETVCVESDGVFPSARAGSIVVEMSTIGVSQGRSLAECAARSDIAFLDSPLSGGEARAASGELTALAGGDERTLERVRPFLECFCTSIYHLGGSGSGYLAKAINQIIYLSYVASFSEAVALGKRAGLDIVVLLDALRASVAAQPLITKWDNRIESGDMTPGFPVRRVLKDLELGEEACRGALYQADIFSQVVKAFRELENRGFAESDLTALYQLKSGNLAGATSNDGNPPRRNQPMT